MDYKIDFKKLPKNIVFWIFIFFVVRLVGITLPPFETGHNWRQTTVTMAARNFYEIDNNILYPRIDFAGEKSGITGMEFPALNYLIYLFAKLFGYDDWYGRLINLIVTSIGCYYFYKIIKMKLDVKIALISTLLLLGSDWMIFGRKIMPDTFATSLVIIGLYYGLIFLEKGKFKSLVLYFLFTCIGVLSKLPCGYLLGILILPFWYSKHKISFVISNVILFTLVAYWYGYWVPYLVKTYGFYHFFMGQDIYSGFLQIINAKWETAHRFIEDAMKFSGFALVLIGLFFVYKNKNKLIAYTVSVCGLLFLVVMFKAGFIFYHHTYYVVPFVPVMSLIAGYGYCQLDFLRFQKYILVIYFIETIINYYPDVMVNKNDYFTKDIETVLDKLSPKDIFERIVINSDPVPTPMYFAHRKGWIESNEFLKNQQNVQDLVSKGCKKIVIIKKKFGSDCQLPYKKVYNSEYFDVYQIAN